MTRLGPFDGFLTRAVTVDRLSVLGGIFSSFKCSPLLNSVLPWLSALAWPGS